MQVMKCEIILLIVIMAMPACTNRRNSKTEGDAITIQLNFDERAIMNASKFVDSISVVLLDDNNDACIGTVSKVDLADSSLIITDLSTMSVFIYHLNGKLKAKIKAHGRGPGEYVALYTTWINGDNKTIGIYDDEQRKILLYSFNGQFIKEYKSPGYIHGFALCGDHGYYYRGMDGFPNDNMQPSNIHLIMTSPDSIKLALQRDFFFENSESMPYQKFVRCNDKILLRTPQEQHIYEISGLNIQLKYRVVLAPNPLWRDENYLKIKTLKDCKDMVNQSIGKIKNLEYMAGNRFLFFSYSKGRTIDVSDLAFSIYDMHTNQVIESGVCCNNKDGFYMKPPVYFNDTLWISSFHQYEIREDKQSEIEKKYHVDFSQSINPILVIRKINLPTQQLQTD